MERRPRRAFTREFKLEVVRMAANQRSHPTQSLRPKIAVQHRARCWRAGCPGLTLRGRTFTRRQEDQISRFLSIFEERFARRA